MKKSDLKKIIDKAEVTKDEVTKGRLVVNLEKDLNKIISVEATSESKARELALELIENEPEGIRGFSLEA